VSRLRLMLPERSLSRLFSRRSRAHSYCLQSASLRAYLRTRHEEHMSNRDELAIEGGIPIRSTPLPNWPQFEPEEIEAASSVLRSGRVNYWTGEQGRLFEAEFADCTHCKHAVALANGSISLELALYALGIKPGDEVIVTSRSFIASAACIVLCGATPVFADVDRDTQNITAESILPALSSRTKAIITVHLAGWPCDMGSIIPIARDRGIAIVEDCAQAHGAEYKSRPVGCLGDIASFSFCQDKIMSTGGEGGMIVTNDSVLWDKVWEFKDHGKNRQLTNPPHSAGEFRWVHDSIGTNLRLTEMQSAIGRVLVRRLARSVEARRRNASMLTTEFLSIPGLRVTCPDSDVYHSYYKYYVFVRPEALAMEWNRDRIVEAIRAEGVPCFTGTCSELYLEKAFAAYRLPGRRLPAAKELGETSMMFLVHPTLTAEDISDVCSAVRKVMMRAVKRTVSRVSDVDPAAKCVA
jgi:dTDP-4-amino-4,6-dideoxygalactose transaminase